MWCEPHDEQPSGSAAAGGQSAIRPRSSIRGRNLNTSVGATRRMRSAFGLRVLVRMLMQAHFSGDAAEAMDRYFGAVAGRLVPNPGADHDVYRPAQRLPVRDSIFPRLHRSTEITPQSHCHQTESGIRDQRECADQHRRAQRSFEVALDREQCG